MNLENVKKIINKNKGKYYVYILRKPNGKPFYVGKGGGRNGWRICSHENNINKNKKSCNEYKDNIIRNILNNGKEINYKIVLFTDNKNEALDKEIELIKFYGRKCKNNGILSNITPGGEGVGNGGKCKGQKRSLEVRKNMSNSHIGKPSGRKGCKLSDEHCKNLSEAHKGYIMPQEQKDKIKKSVTITKNSFKYKKELEKLSKRMKGENNPAKRLEVRKKISMAKKGFKHTEESKLKMSKSHKGIKLSKEHCEKISKGHKGKAKERNE